jgi:hypothetical protein
MDPDYFDANAALKVTVLTEGIGGNQIDSIGVVNNPGAIEIVLTTTPPAKGYYVGSVYDSRYPNEGPIGYVKINVYQ